MRYNLYTKIPAADTRADLYDLFSKWPKAELLVARNAKDAYDSAEVSFLFDDAPVRITYGHQRHYPSNLRAVYLTLEGIRMAYKRGLGDILTGTVSQMLKLGAGAVTRDPYEVLGVRPDAPMEVIEASYRALAKSAHPDAGGSDEAMSELNEAMERVKTERAA